MNNILFVIVLYNKTREQSLAWQSLCKCLSAEQLQKVYIHDNTRHNIYLAAAYNLALRKAQDEGYTWLCLLDDDTEVTAEYIESLTERTSQDNETKVWVPRLVGSDGKIMSPFRHLGILTALNSGTVISTSVMQSIGGFNVQYPLDYLDYWLFRELHRRRISIGLLSAKLIHHLSCSDYSDMPRERYLSILKAEKQFAGEGGYAVMIYYKFQLLGRLIKWTLTKHPYILETFRQLTGRQP